SQGFDPTNSPPLDGIRIGHSSDGGKTIDSRFNAEDGAVANLFMHPYLIREPSGPLDIVYYAGAADNDTMGSFRRSQSTDGGKTWAPSAVVKTPLTFLSSRDSAKWL